MSALRMLVANEPRSYQDAIASLVRLLRPTVDVIVADPDGIDAALDAVRAQLSS